MKAVLSGTVLAESGETVEVEGNAYFPPNSVKPDYFRDSDTHTTCPWKGLASYYDIVAGGKTIKDGAWYYPDPKPAAAKIKGHVAFSAPVKVQD